MYIECTENDTLHIALEQKEYIAIKDDEQFKLLQFEVFIPFRLGRTSSTQAASHSVHAVSVMITRQKWRHSEPGGVSMTAKSTCHRASTAHATPIEAGRRMLMMMMMPEEAHVRMQHRRHLAAAMVVLPLLLESGGVVMVGGGGGGVMTQQLTVCRRRQLEC